MCAARLHHVQGIPLQEFIIREWVVNGWCCLSRGCHCGPLCATGITFDHRTARKSAHHTLHFKGARRGSPCIAFCGRGRCGQCCVPLIHRFTYKLRAGAARVHRDADGIGFALCDLVDVIYIRIDHLVGEVHQFAT